MSYWKLGYHLWYEPRLGARSSTDLWLSSPSHMYSRNCPLDRQGRSTDVDYYAWTLRFPTLWGVSEPTKWLHRFENGRSIWGASQQQQPHKSNSSGRVKPLTPLLARKNRMPSLTSSPVFGSYRVWNSRSKRYTKLRHKGLALIITTRLCFSTEASINCHLGMPHRQFTPCVWYPSIYNPWARTSQRRALNKRINSPPLNRYIFNRDQSVQKKIQCQTHSPFTSSFWVWTKPEALNTSHMRTINKSVRTATTSTPSR